MQKTKTKKNDLLKPVVHYWYLFALFAVMSYVVNQAIVVGSSKIATATDQLFTGTPIVLGVFVQPFIVLVLIGTAATFVKSYMKGLYSVNVQTEVKNLTTAKLVRLQYSYFDTKGTGSIMNRLITDVYRIEDLFSEMIPEMAMVVVAILTVGTYILLMDYRLFLVTIVCYPVLFWCANKLSKKMGQLTGNRMELYDRFEETALDSFNGMIVGRSYNLYEVLKKRIGDVVAAILRNEYTRTMVGSVSQVLSNVIRWIPCVICYVFAFYEVLHQRLTVGELLAFSLLLNEIVHPVGEIPNLLNGIREELVSFRRINEILQELDELSGTGSFAPTEECICLSHLQFAYHEDRVIFKDLNMQIARGSNTALVGSSGGGKSTVFHILCGFYIPQSGSYQLYGKEYGEWNVQELRKQFALVSQNVFLFPGTIAENVAYGREGASLEEVQEACRNANIHSFIESLPDGYRTQVGERGVKLSGGQRQRISIARAFLKEAPIVLLDEPTSAVDVETEEMIQQALERIAQGRTVLTIAHRLSTIVHADNILVFDGGTIAEQGTHEALMAKKGVYYRLYMKENAVQEGGAVHA